MATTQDLQAEILGRVIKSFRTGKMASPFADTELTDADAYAVQYKLIERLKGQGEVVRGHKVALTTQAARAHLGVDEPCYGHILNERVYANGAQVPLAELADPHCEAEIAFMLGEDLKGPGITSAQVMAATRAVLPSIELVKCAPTTHNAGSRRGTGVRLSLSPSELGARMLDGS